MILKLYPTIYQQKILNEFIHTSRYVYNKTVEEVKNGHRVNFQDLRDKLVTVDTKKHHEEYKVLKREIETLRELKSKSEDKDIIKNKNTELRNLLKTFDFSKNSNVKNWESFTPKDIRSNAVKRFTDAQKTAMVNIERGNIKYFEMKFKKKSDPKQTVELSPKNIKMVKGVIRIAPRTFGKECVLRIGKRNKKKHRNLTIDNNVDIVKNKNGYYLHVVTSTVVKNQEYPENIRVCGVDPGVRTLATVYSLSTGVVTEYQHGKDILRALNKKIDSLKNCRKKQFSKVENRKENLVKNLHCDFINHLLENNDVVFFGDINSHAIVKNSDNKYTNRDTNDLKFYQLKQRLLFKASLLGKRVTLTPEPNTTKGCSSCGTLNHHVGKSKIFRCPCCQLVTGRDENASKNIGMRGLLS